VSVQTLERPGSATFVAEPAAPPVLRIRGLVKSFNGRRVLDNVDLDVRRGEMVVVLGANGSGKSTLLRCTVRLLDADEGQVVLADRDMRLLSGRQLREARRGAAMIFQDIHLVRRRSAYENVAFGALGRLPLHQSFSSRRFPPDVRALAHASLHRVGLSPRTWQRADTLSGGEAQRVAIARALCQQPEVILADEPVASLDPAASHAVLGLLREIAREARIGVACVLHQPELARTYADRIVGIVAGRVAFDALPEQVEEDAVEALYGRDR
jgi:phosphonate transport system ATP-binding protein